MAHPLEGIVQAALEIEREEAQEAGAIGYMARALVQATLPHRDPKTDSFSRTNGDYTLAILGTPGIGVPWGSLPRVLLAWLSTEAIRTKSPTVELGETLSEFMHELELLPTGGRWGSITRLRSQMERLFSSSIKAVYRGEDRFRAGTIELVNDADLWWDPQKPDQVAMWKSTVTLGEKFFQELLGSPVPVDLRAIKALQRSPLALDIYCWLTHRMSYLKAPARIPWEALQAQFGSDYADVRKFRYEFIRRMKQVCHVYKEARVTEDKGVLVLQPSPPHVMRRLAGKSESFPG